MDEKKSMDPELLFLNEAIKFIVTMNARTKCLLAEWEQIKRYVAGEEEEKKIQ